MSERFVDTPLSDDERAISPGSLRKEDVAVIVPTRNSSAKLRLCLESIRSQRQPCTLIVVDNRSTDDTPYIADELADIVLRCGPERSAQRYAQMLCTNRLQNRYRNQFGWRLITG